MIVFGALIVVVIVTVIFYFRDPQEYKWWEFGIPLLITLGMIFGAKALTDHMGVMFTEYWGETITSIHEEEPWNEWISQTCTESYPCGTDSDGNTQYCTRTYDCSYQADYGPKWYCKTNLGNTYEMSEKRHDEYVALFGTGKRVAGTHKNHSARTRCAKSDGTKFQGKTVGNTSNIYATVWSKNEQTRKGVFTKHRYENRIKASDLTVFNIPVVSKIEADSMGLFEYPKDIDKYTCPVILGDENISEETQDLFRRLNAKFGPTNQLRLWILIFEDKPAITSTYQENYWVRGNKNELIVCIGKKGNEIQWVHSFSWALSGTLTAESAQKVLEMYELSIKTKSGQTLPAAIPITAEMKKAISQSTGIDTAMLPPVLPLGVAQQDVLEVNKSKTPVLTDQTWEAYYKYLDANLNRFERRSFEEFSYIKVEPKTSAIIVIYVLALLISIGLNFYVSNNEFNDKPDRGWNNRYRGRY